MKIVSILQAYKPLTFFGGIGLILWAVGLAALLPLGLLPGSIGLVLGAGALVAGAVSAAVGLIVHAVNVRILEISDQLSKLS